MTSIAQKKVSEILGLCLKAGQLETGQESSVELIRNGQAGIAFIDESASDNTKKRLHNACSFHAVPVYEMAEELIGHSIGKPNRYIAVIRSGGFTKKLLSILQDEITLNGNIRENAGV